MSNIKRSSGISRLLTLVVSLMVSLATAALISGTGAATAAPPNTGGGSGMTANVTGTANGNPLSGTFKTTQFANQNGQLVAIGDIAGQITNPDGTTTPFNPTGVALPVDLAQSNGSCEILNLVLGPLDLNLLGLEVHLDTVTLNITAQQGSGNLLGNLLCTVAGLLDGPANANALVNLLNQILGLLA